jgi:signal transduction histidine kinase
MTDDTSEQLRLSEESRQLAERIVTQAEPAVRRVLSESWDISGIDLERDIRLYAAALIRSVESGAFDELETYLIGMDSLWQADQFAISPLIRAMFIVQDVTCEFWPSDDAQSLAYHHDVINDFTRRAIVCLSDRSVKLVTGRLARQVEEHREGEARLMSLQRVGAALVSDLDLDRSLQLIADEARRLIGADGVLIRMATEDGQLQFVTGSGDESLFMRTTRLLPGSSLSSEALRTATPMCVDDIRCDSRVNRDYLSISRSRSLLIVPLIARDRPVGVITGTSTAVAAFADRDISILSLFADQAASAIENARLFQQAHQQIHELEALHRVSQLVSSSLDLEQIFQTLYEEVARLMPADSFLVALARPDGLHDFEFIIDDGQRYPPRRGLQLSPILSEGLVDGDMVIQRDVRRHRDYKHANRFGNAERETICVLAAPLMRGDQVIGMISAQSYVEHDYRDPEARMLRTIASQAAIAIEHARLYRQAQNVAVAEERARLAREIHDTLAQGLIGVILCLERLDLAVPLDDGVYRPWIERALELSRGSLEEARRSVRDLRAAPLEGRTFLEAVANLVADVRDDHEFEVRATLPPSLPPLSARVETALFRVVQEAISNASKHADCQLLGVEIETRETTLVMRICDDGVGFEPAETGDRTEHYGLTTMRERVLQIGGRIEIQSSTGEGTTVRVELPVPVAVHREYTEDSGAEPDE